MDTNPSISVIDVAIPEDEACDQTLDPTLPFPISRSSASNKSAGSTSTSTSLPIPGSGNTGGANSAGYASKNVTTQVTIAATSQIKTKMRYIVVQKNGPCLELSEPDDVTPEEMVGVTKFLTLVNAVLGACMMGYNMSIDWSEVISDLAIDRHFVVGQQSLSMYTPQTEVLDIILIES